MPGNSGDDVQRVASVAHFVIAASPPGKLGHVKLNRILWHADAEHYRGHGVSLTGLRQYARMPQGPIAAAILRAVGLLVREGKVVEQTVEVDDYTRREMNYLEPPDLAAFTEEQIVILGRWIDVIAPLTAAQLSRMTHDDPLWQEIGNGDGMSVATGSIVTRAPRSE
jgi:hypothetical protein